jgi:hypothetical protein
MRYAITNQSLPTEDQHKENERAQDPRAEAESDPRECADHSPQDG